MEFVEERVEILDDVRYYKDQYNTIHIDEKWFYMDKVCRKIYLASNEEPPERSVRNTNYMEKVMFLAAVARPRQLTYRPRRGLAPVDWHFDGKIALYPLVEYGMVTRGRTAGRQRVTNLSINAETFENFLVDKLLMDIAHNCPTEMLSEVVFIQLDNATPHRINTDRFNRKCVQIGIDCRLVYQPSQSPDMNICDLSFFPAIQSLYYKTPGVDTVNRLIAAVEEAFTNFDPCLLNRAFLTLFMNYNQILLNEGGNNYKLPHMGKEALENMGELPEKIAVVDANMVANVPDDVIEGMLNDADNFNDMIFEEIDENE
jgi:hypothetical protein